MATPQIVTIIDKFGNETDLEACTNYNHDKLVGLYQEESEQFDGCDAHDFYDWCVVKGYYKVKNEK